MRSASHKVCVFAVVGILPLLTPAPSSAELTRVEITRRVDVLNGKAFGDVGPYEKLHGKAYFAIDPQHPRNQVIADIGLAPRNREGKVEFSADLFILKPKDSARGNGVVFFDVVNRGSFRFSARSVPRPRPTTRQRKRSLATPRCSFRASPSSPWGGSSTSRMTPSVSMLPSRATTDNPYAAGCVSGSLQASPVTRTTGRAATRRKGISQSTSTPPITD